MIYAVIKDRLALESLKVEAIEDYLRGTGWMFAGRQSLGGKIPVAAWRKPDPKAKIPWEIYVPDAVPRVADHAARISDLIEALELIERRSQLDVFVALGGDLNGTQTSSGGAA